MPAKRPAINAPMTVCTRTLADDQDTAAKVANPSCNITFPSNRDIIAHWAGALEIEILIAFKMDPKRYKIRLHDLTPTDQPCPEGKEVRSLNNLDLSDAKPVVDGAYEVHFELRDNVTPPTVEELRQWQQRWDVTAADPAPPPAKTTVTFRHSNRRPMRVDIASLSRPFACDVQSAIRSKLGLLSEKDLFQANFGKVFDVDLAREEVLFHLSSQECSEKRDIDELRTAPSDAAQSIRVHIGADEEVVGVAQRKKAPRKKNRKRNRGE